MYRAIVEQSRACATSASNDESRRDVCGSFKAPGLGAKASSASADEVTLAAAVERIALAADHHIQRLTRGYRDDGLNVAPIPSNVAAALRPASVNLETRDTSRDDVCGSIEVSVDPEEVEAEGLGASRLQQRVVVGFVYLPGPSSFLVRKPAVPAVNVSLGFGPVLPGRKRHGQPPKGCFGKLPNQTLSSSVEPSRALDPV
jgi:hypothetical protein